MTTLKEENRMLILTSIAKSNIHAKKILICKGKGTELICTYNIW